MALYSTLASLSQTAASNAADGAVDAPSTIDQQTNLLASFIAQLRDGNGFATGLNNVGQCRLTKSGANLLLSPYQGNGLTINGVVCKIPSAGLTLAPTSLTPSTTYYIYAVATGTNVSSIEASTTGHSTDTTTGVEIKTGDATRTLVGMARIITGPAWVDTATQRFVISWFNRRALELKNAMTANVANSGAVYSEITVAGLRTEFLIWSGDSSQHSFTGYLTSNLAGGFAATSYALDGTVVDGSSQVITASTASPYPVACTGTVGAAAEGYHYMAVFARSSSGFIVNYAGQASASDRCVNYGVIQG